MAVLPLAPLTADMGGRTGALVQYAPSTHGLGFLRYDVRAFMPGDPQPDPENRWLDTNDASPYDPN